jgi:predicted DNA-binding transcriptional regulator AlpA
MDRLISIRETAHRLGLTTDHVRRLYSSGRIKRPTRIHPQGNGFYLESYIETLIGVRAGEAADARASG